MVDTRASEIYRPSRGKSHCGSTFWRHRASPATMCAPCPSIDPALRLDLTIAHFDCERFAPPTTHLPILPVKILVSKPE
jgi:hypothetical protein